MDIQFAKPHWPPRVRRGRKGSLASTITIVMASFAVSAISLLLTPSRPSSTDQRVFSQGLRVHLTRTSPAFAAFEDSRLPERLPSYETVQASNEPMAVEYLTAGVSAAAAVVERIQREIRREASLVAQERLERERAAQALADLQAQQSPPPQPSAPEAAKPTPYVHPTKTIRLAELKISRDELLRELLMPLAESNSASETMIASGTEASVSRMKGRSPTASGLAGMARAPVATRREPGPRAARGMNDLPGGQIEKRALAEDGAVLERNDQLHQIVIAGAIEISGGLALSNPTDRVVVYREDEEQPIESAAVWVREGRYEIFVEEPVGTLVAELRTPHGELLGRGVFGLEYLPAVRKNQYRVDRVNLKIAPVPQGISGVVASVDGAGNKPPVRKPSEIAVSDLPIVTASRTDGSFEETTLLEGSSVILRTKTADHWTTLSQASAGATNLVTIFPDRFMKTFGRLVRSPVDLARAGIVWGRVTRQGTAVAGARVDLVTTPTAMKPVYFNASMVPDQTLEATSENGLYAFYDVPPGAHAVQAGLAGAAPGEPRLFPVEEKAVSHVEVELGITRKATVRAFDAFRTDWPLAVSLVSPGLIKTTSIDTSGTGALRYAAGAGPLIVDASAGPSYERVRLTLTRDRRSLYVPMVQSVWIDRIRGAMRLNTELRTGTVVGFIQGTAPYRVEMHEESLAQGSRVIYFDSRGEVIRGQKGLPGGGFILFNIPEGFRTVAVAPEGSAKIFATTVLVEPKVTNVINHWIR